MSNDTTNIAKPPVKAHKRHREPSTKPLNTKPISTETVGKSRQMSKNITPPSKEAE